MKNRSDSPRIFILLSMIPRKARKFRKSRKCYSPKDKGFGNLFLVALLPLLLSIVALLLGFVLAVQKVTQTQHMCRTTLIQSQMKMAQHLTQLINLNPLAQQLRLKMRLAQAALVAALASQTPAAISAAQRGIKVIRMKQIRLKKKQLFYIQQANLKAHLIRPFLSSQLSLTIPLLSLKVRSPYLAVFPSPPTSLSPSYKPKPFFSKRQKASAQWTFSPLLLPQWTRSYFPQDLNFQAQCQTTIIKENKKWISALAPAKSLLSF